MQKSTSRARLSLAIATALGLSSAAQAVYLNPDGLGQALIYPYYTVRSVKGNAFNTFASVVNHTPDAKVVRVRFLEGRNARVVQGFNLYLSPNDVWTGAIVPLGADGARVISTDTSCTNGAFDNSELGPLGRTFQNVFYAGSNSDGFGEGLDRTREGYIEMIEMAALTGASAAAIGHRTNGTPFDCPSMLGDPPVQLSPPTGGLSGTLTLINVQNGSDFTVNAEALAELSTQPFYRQPADPYPGFDAAEVTPVSVVQANGKVYRSTWTRGADAVSATLMRADMTGEFVLAAATRSRTDFVTTFPTRRNYASGATGTGPFAPTPFGDYVSLRYTNREERSQFRSCEFFSCLLGWNSPVTVFTFSDSFDAHTLTGDGVLGSQRGPGFSDNSPSGGNSGPTIPVLFDNGWVTMRPVNVASAAGQGQASLTSGADSTRMDVATGQITTGAHVHFGLPVVGFTVRTFENGTLSCGAGACQGNYGGSFPLKYNRLITP